MLVEATVPHYTANDQDVPIRTDVLGSLHTGWTGRPGLGITLVDISLFVFQQLITGAIRGLLRTSKPEIRIDVARAEEMLDDFAALPVVRCQRRALALRDSFTACDAFYVALAESLDMPLCTDDHEYARAAGHTVVETWA